MTSADYAQVLRRRWRWALAAFCLVFGVVFLALRLSPVGYASKAQVLFSVTSGLSAGGISDGTVYTERHIETYQALATSPMVLNKVIAKLNWNTSAPALAESLSVTFPKDTALLDISATMSSPEASATLANSVANEVAAAAMDLSPALDNGKKLVAAQVIERASYPAAPKSSSPSLMLTLGFFVALCAGALGAFLRELLVPTIRTPRDLAALDAPSVLAVIPRESLENLPLSPVTRADGKARAAARRYDAAIVRLRARVQLLSSVSTAAYVLTSSVGSEGTTTTAIALAQKFADSGSKVALIDADFVHPKMAKMVGFHGGPGLGDVLAGDVRLDEALRRPAQLGFDVLSSPEPYSHGSDVIASGTMVPLIRELERTYEVVLIKASPLAASADPLVLGRLAAGLLLVVGLDRVTREELASALQSAGSAAVPVLGILLNKAAARSLAGWANSNGRSREDRSASSPSAILQA